MLQDDFNKQFGLALKSENTEEFPVLKAFQSYIEAEREKARRKMLLMATAFGGVILLLVVVFGMILTVFVGKMFDQQNRAQDRMYSLMTQPQVQNQPSRAEVTPAVITQVVVRTEVQTSPDVGRKAEVLAAFEPPAKPEPVKAPALPDETKQVAKPEPKPMPKAEPKPILKPIPRPLAGVTPPPAPEGTVETVVQVEGRTAGTIEWRIYAPK